MRKKLIGIFICVLMLVGIITPLSRIIIPGSSIPLEGGNILYVGGNGPGNYTTIQDAIDAAESGDTVFVYHGTYAEIVWVGKSLNLIGEDRDTTIIDGGGSNYVVHLTADHVTFSGFTVQHGSVGIIVLADNVQVVGNRFLDNGNDIWLSYSNNTISDNILLGGGLFITYAIGHQNSVTNNIVQGRPLVYLEGEKNTVVNVDAGQDVLVDCESITVQDQSIQDISTGIYLVRSNNCLLTHNTISHCFTGMDFFQSENNDITANTITNITAFGIHLYASTVNTLSQNTVSGSVGGSGIYLEPSSTDNTIANNTLLSNNQCGVHVGSNHTTISDNVISMNPYAGVALYSVSFCTVQRNIISLCDSDGITASGSTNCLFSGNTITHGQFGIRQFSCFENTVTKNTFRNQSWSGILLDNSHDIGLSENTFTNDSECIYLMDAVHNSITKNTLQGNANGIVLLSSSQNSIEKNDIIKNGKGIYLMASDDNTISQNNFKRNEQQAFFLDGNNTWNGNYWNRPRLLPYPVMGKRTMTLPLLKEIQLPKINFDMHPAFLPYTIP